MTEKLLADQTAALQELNRLEERKRLLEFHIEYITKLLESANAPEGAAKVHRERLGRFYGETIADVAAMILGESGMPMSATEIARKAMEGGFLAENIERARSHFSAVISKDIGSSNPRFRQFGRGSIGLAIWPERPHGVGDLLSEAM